MLAAAKDQAPVSSWLIPALSVLVMAVVSLIVTNARADRREWNKWRRDTLITLCSEALAQAQEAKSRCVSALNQTDSANVQTDLAAVFQAATAMGTISERLYLMNANFLADTCAELKAAANEVYSSTGRLQVARVSAHHRLDSETKQLIEQGPGRFAIPSPRLRRVSKRNF